jgi:flagellar M-ring protein FliF
VAALLEGLKALGPARLAAMGLVGLGMLGMLAMLALRGGGERMALLYGDLDLREAAQMTDLLSRQHIAFQLVGQGNQILVPTGEIAHARLALAKEGLPSGGSVGYEIFDRTDGLAANQFQQTINETRALEGELARTIRAINGIRAARVHLVLARREPFERNRQEAQASVVLTMAGAARLDREGVQAILNLVAAAVPGLRPQAIAVIDSRGNVLARAGQPTGAAGEAEGAEELRRATEIRLARAVEEMLERSLGPGHVRAEAAVEMDFDRLNETEEKFDPDGQVVRSQQTTNDSSKTTEQNGTVSVSNNLPNADAANAGTGSQEAKQEETTNYEIGKTVRTVIREQPRIHRISLAVMIDGVETRGADGASLWKERSAEEIGRITTLVRSAIGYDEKRGDHVEVVSMRFANSDEPDARAAPSLFGLALEKTDIVRLAETAVLALIGILALLLVVRPTAIRLAALPSASAEGSVDASMVFASSSGLPALPGPGGSIATGALRATRLAGGHQAAPDDAEDNDMINVANIDGQMRVSSIRKVGELVAKHPDESLSIIRTWLAQEGG